MKKTLLFSLLGAAVLSMGTANAGGGSLFGGTGESDMMDSIYVGGSIGQATSRCMITNTDDDCDTDGWKVFGGYKFTDNIAAEVGYYNIGSAEEKMTTDSFGTITTEAEATGVGLTGVYSHELTDGLDVFGKAGLMMWNLEGTAHSSLTGTSEKEEEDGTSFMYGLGASYQVTDNIGVRGEWERYTAEYKSAADGKSHAEETDVDILSAGVTFSTY